MTSLPAVVDLQDGSLRNVKVVCELRSSVKMISIRMKLLGYERWYKKEVSKAV